MSRKECDHSSKHGIDSAEYIFDGYGFAPRLLCICGKSCRGNSWEQAGEELDDHLLLFDVKQTASARAQAKKEQ